jgi:hypothetical protein
VRTYEVPAAALNDLELLRTLCPFDWRDPQKPSGAKRDGPKCRELRATIDAREESIVRRTWPTPQSMNLPSSAVKLEASATPSGIAWRLRFARRISNPIALVAVVYEFDLDRMTWYAIASASGPVAQSELHRQGDFEIAGFRSLLTRSRPAQCLDNGVPYRIEIRLAGVVLARSRAATPAWLPHFGGVPLNEQGIAFCVPDGLEGWIRAPVHPDHLEAAFRSRGGTEGTDLYSFFEPRDASAAARHRLRQRAIGDTLQRLQGRGLAGRPLNSATEQCPDVPLPANTERIAFRTGTLTLLAQSWSARDGLLHVAIIWRQDTSAPQERTVTCRVLQSMTSLEAQPRPAPSRG